MNAQSVLPRLEDKQKLLQQSHILKTAFIVTADDTLPDDLVTTIQVSDSSHMIRVTDTAW